MIFEQLIYTIQYTSVKSMLDETHMHEAHQCVLCYVRVV
jgi:hypothetical protein